MIKVPNIPQLLKLNIRDSALFSNICDLCQCIVIHTQGDLSPLQVVT